jgi:hypothetical protein
MIKGRTSVGKTFPISVILHLFPNATIITGATPKNFFYANGEKVDEAGYGINPRLDQIEDELSLYRGQLTAGEDLAKAALERERRSLLSNSRILLDFRGKIFGVLDSVPQELWDTLKTALSHDSYESEYQTVVDGRQRVVLIRGWPCVIYATAANEEKRYTWEQIRNRFVIITPVASSEKFQAANELTADLYGLPSVALQTLYPQKKLEDAKVEIREALSLIKSLRKASGTSDDDPTANIVFNPFRKWLTGLFPHVVGEDMRRFRYLLAYINVGALMNAPDRVRLTVDEREVAVVASWEDVERAIGLIGKDLAPLTADKVEFYEKWIRALWRERTDKAIEETKKRLGSKLTNDEAVKQTVASAFTVADVIEYARRHGQALSRSSVRDTFLDLYVDVGLLMEDNPDRKANQAIEYRPAVDDDRVAQFLQGFAIPAPPESQIVNEAIAELGGVLTGKGVGWTFDGQTVNIGEGRAFLLPHRHTSFELGSANEDQILQESPNHAKSAPKPELARPPTPSYEPGAGLATPADKQHHRVDDSTIIRCACGKTCFTEQGLRDHIAAREAGP